MAVTKNTIRYGAICAAWLVLSASGTTAFLDETLHQGTIRTHPNALLGHWNCQDISADARLTTEKTYAAGGLAQVSFHLEYQNTEPKDEMGMHVAGLWHLEGDILVEQGVEFEYWALNVGGEDMLGSPLEAALTAEMRHKAASSRVVELTPDRLVLTPLDTPQKLVCLRQE